MLLSIPEMFDLINFVFPAHGCWRNFSFSHLLLHLALHQTLVRLDADIGDYCLFVEDLSTVGAFATIGCDYYSGSSAGILDHNIKGLVIVDE